MAEDKDKTPSEGTEGGNPAFPELEAIQQEVEKRLRDNKKFLEHFLDEDFEDEEADEEEEENFEEL